MIVKCIKSVKSTLFNLIHKKGKLKPTNVEEGLGVVSQCCVISDDSLLEMIKAMIYHNFDNVSSTLIITNDKLTLDFIFTASESDITQKHINTIKDFLTENLMINKYSVKKLPGVEGVSALFNLKELKRFIGKDIGLEGPENMLISRCEDYYGRGTDYHFIVIKEQDDPLEETDVFKTQISKISILPDYRGEVRVADSNDVAKALEYHLSPLGELKLQIDYCPKIVKGYEGFYILTKENPSPEALEKVCEGLHNINAKGMIKGCDYPNYEYLIPKFYEIGRETEYPYVAFMNMVSAEQALLDDWKKRILPRSVHWLIAEGKLCFFYDRFF